LCPSASPDGDASPPLTVLEQFVLKASAATAIAAAAAAAAAAIFDPEELSEFLRAASMKNEKFRNSKKRFFTKTIHFGSSQRRYVPKFKGF